MIEKPNVSDHYVADYFFFLEEHHGRDYADKVILDRKVTPSEILDFYDNEAEILPVALAHWVNRRKFMAKGIDRPGTFLDVGCGSGMMQYSLAHWSGHDLIQFGIDLDEQGVRRARQLFNDRKRFVIGDFIDADILGSFTYTYMSMFSNDDFPFAECANKIAAISDHRIIFGFYEDIDEKGIAYRTAIVKPILKQYGFDLAEEALESSSNPPYRMHVYERSR